MTIYLTRNDRPKTWVWRKDLPYVVAETALCAVAAIIAQAIAGWYAGIIAAVGYHAMDRVHTKRHLRRAAATARRIFTEYAEEMDAGLVSLGDQADKDRAQAYARGVAKGMILAGATDDAAILKAFDDALAEQTAIIETAKEADHD